MCGLAGLLLGPRQHTAADREYLHSVFAELLRANLARGHHATGAALQRDDGSAYLTKRPMDAESFLASGCFSRFLSAADSNDVRILMGHTRYRTRGSEARNANNHPIRAGHTIGTHNGTITNADALFRRFRLRRSAEVDSEVLVRMVDRCWTSDGLSVPGLLEYLRECDGRMTALFFSRRDPGRVLIVKGNNPLSIWYHHGLRAWAYASEERHLEEVLFRRRWEDVSPSMMTIPLLNIRTGECEQAERLRFNAFP